MKITILGSGTSTGVPEIGCKCPVCTSSDPRDNRLRCSGLIETEGLRILIDCGPDFREQMIRLNDFKPLDGVLITHEHYDHVGGLDDCVLSVVFAMCRFMPNNIRQSVYASVFLIVLPNIFIREFPVLH